MEKNFVIDESLLNEAIKEADEQNMTENDVVNLALKEYITMRQRLHAFDSMVGKVDFDASRRVLQYMPFPRRAGFSHGFPYLRCGGTQQLERLHRIRRFFQLSQMDSRPFASAGMRGGL
jgi:hypothetical protein